MINYNYFCMGYEFWYDGKVRFSYDKNGLLLYEIWYKIDFDYTFPDRKGRVSRNDTPYSLEEIIQHAREDLTKELYEKFLERHGNDQV